LVDTDLSSSPPLGLIGFSRPDLISSSSNLSGGDPPLRLARPAETCASYFSHLSNNGENCDDDYERVSSRLGIGEQHSSSSLAADGIAEEGVSSEDDGSASQNFPSSPKRQRFSRETLGSDSSSNKAKRKTVNQRWFYKSTACRLLSVCNTLSEMRLYCALAHVRNTAVGTSVSVLVQTLGSSLDSGK
jgi:hypothetical protein